MDPCPDQGCPGDLGRRGIAAWVKARPQEPLDGLRAGPASSPVVEGVGDKWSRPRRRNPGRTPGRAAGRGAGPAAWSMASPSSFPPDDKGWQLQARACGSRSRKEQNRLPAGPAPNAPRRIPPSRRWGVSASRRKREARLGTGHSPALSCPVLVGLTQQAAP